MDERAWLMSDDPAKMLAWMTGPAIHPCRTGGPLLAPSDRKLRLFACACVRQVWPLLTDPRSRRALEVAERYADGLASKEDLYSAWGGACDVWENGEGRQDHLAAVAARFDSADVVQGLKAGRRDPIVPNAVQAALLRDVFGNPWKPVGVLEKCRPCHGRGGWEDPEEGQFVTHVACGGKGEIPPPWLAWNDGAVRKMAEVIYQDRAFDRMPLLADALEEAGCADAAILGHCRGTISVVDPEPWEHRRRADFSIATLEREMAVRLMRLTHTRGCWVLDLLLSKE